MNIFAIDPGTTQSAWVANIGDKIFGGIVLNEVLHSMLRTLGMFWQFDAYVIEEIQGYGMPVGKEVFKTVHWSGRFFETIEDRLPLDSIGVQSMPRKEVKISLCGQLRAKDSNIRAALIDIYGGSKQTAIGLKKSPGPLYGFKADMWAALGVHEAYKERVKAEVRAA